MTTNVKVDVSEGVAKVRQILGGKRASLAEDSDRLNHVEQLIAHMGQGSVGSDDPVRSMLARVGDKWTVLVVLVLSVGPIRYGELRRVVNVIADMDSLRISAKVLSASLRVLQRDGMVRRTVFGSVPPQVDYELTPLGLELHRVIGDLLRWAQVRAGEIEAARRQFDSAQ